MITGKNQLAEALGYSTDYFFRMVNGNVNIWNALSRVGYQKRSRTLTPKQVEIICNYYGWPDCYDKD